MKRSTELQKLTSVRQQLIAVDPGVSARSSTRPRRRCGTGLDDDGFVERLVATNDGDAGAPHVAHSRRGVSLTQRPQYTSAPLRRRLTVDGRALRVIAGRRNWSHLLVTRIQSVDRNNRQDVCSCPLSITNCVRKRAFFVTLHLKQLHAHLRPSNRKAHNSCYQHCGKLRRGAHAQV